MRWLLALLLAVSPAATRHREKGLNAEVQGKDDEAAAEFKLAVEADPSDAISQHELGKILFKKGDLPAAIERFQAAVKLEEKNATAWYNLAYARRKAQRFEQAAEAYQRYTALAPDDPDGYFGLAESLRQSGKTKEAVAAYKAYVAKEARPSEQKWVAKSKERIAELEKPAPGLLLPSTATSPSPSPSTSTSTSTPTPTQTATPSSTSTSTAAAVTAARAKVAEGDRAFNAKDFRAALFAYQDAISADPGNAEALLKAGNAYARLGHDDEAIEQWNRALQLDPQSAAARDAIAAARERKGELAQKPAVRPAAVPAPPLPLPPQIDEAGARAHYGKGVALIGGGKYDEAIADYTAARQADPSLAAPLFGLAEAYRGLGQTDKAADLYRQFAASNAPDAQVGLKQYALQNAQALAPK
jgi:tetratricopeptide (TPR) repeat protein